MRSDWDLYFVCICIEGLSRRNKLSKKDVILSLGKDGLQWMLDSAKVNHSDPLEFHLDDLVEKFSIPYGDYELEFKGKFQYPSEVAMGTQYSYVVESLNTDRISALIEVFSDEWFCSIIDDYNYAMFWQSPEYLKEMYLTKEVPNVMG